MSRGARFPSTEVLGWEKQMDSWEVDARRAWGAALLRLSVGAIYAAHGVNKLLAIGPAGVAATLAADGIVLPGLNAWLVIAIELAGGIALLAGLRTRLAAGVLAVLMAIAVAAIRAKHGFFLPNGAEYTLLLFMASTALVLQGPGAFALDNVRAARARPKAGAGRAAREAPAGGTAPTGGAAL